MYIHFSYQIVMLILYSHILIQLRDTTKRIKSARKREMDYKENTVTICHVPTGKYPSFHPIYGTE